MQFFLFIALLQFRMQSFKDGLPEIALQIAIAHQPHTRPASLIKARVQEADPVFSRKHSWLD